MFGHGIRLSVTWPVSSFGNGRRLTLGLTNHVTERRYGRRHRMPRDETSFTLVEILIATMILVIIASSTLLIFRGISRAWQTGQLRTERYQQARLLFDLFARELSSCVANSRYPVVGYDAGVGVPLKDDSLEDALFFVGALPGRAGLVERGYWVNSRRQLMCHDQEPADGDYGTVQADEVCGEQIAEFQVSYFDGSAWLTAWDGRVGAAQAGAIPKALRMALSFQQREDETFETVITLPTS